MRANVPQQRLEQRPNDAAEDHSSAQPRAVCKAAFYIAPPSFMMFLGNDSPTSNELRLTYLQLRHYATIYKFCN